MKSTIKHVHRQSGVDNAAKFTAYKSLTASEDRDS